MYIERRITGHIKKMLKKFPVVTLTGPRQSGKTTLLRTAFGDYGYYNLERPDIREIISVDPMGFLKNAGQHIIFDEAQNLPMLFSYIQAVSDERGMNGQYILSGSQSFLLNNQISQSLAGRTSINILLPFEINELGKPEEHEPYRLIYNGLYPRIYDQKIDPSDFYPYYIQTYIERDIRSLRAIENLQSFTRFLGLCAGRTGQILNLSSLAGDAGVAVNTAKAWLSLLEASYIIYLLQPFHRNFNKRIIKSPKLYFLDTGVAASLLRITEPGMLASHYLSGALFENLVIGEIMKWQVHSGRRPSLYYWRESNGVEADCIVENENGELLVIEIKAGQTFSKDFLRNLKLFPADEKECKIRKMVIYGGPDTIDVNDIQVIPWNVFTENKEMILNSRQ